MNTDLLESVWRDFTVLPLFGQTWPETMTLSALEALRIQDDARACRLEADAVDVRKFGRLPIIAVAGLKNAGKSSLVSSFLSPENRPRLIIGIDSIKKATNRFTLWLPARWESESGLLARLKERLAEIFGHAAEDLAIESGEAHAQQLDASAIGRPLLAFDPALDAHGLALVDCPDIETARGDTSATNPRLRMLERARDFCAGVIIVLPHDRIAVNTVEVILQYLPQAVRIFALNLARDESPTPVAAELANRLGQWPEFIYLAFDSQNRGYADRTPACDPKTEQVPFFFAVDPEPENNVPAAVAPERAIQQIGRRLPPEVLSQRSQREQRKRFARECLRALDDVISAKAAMAREINSAGIDLFKTVRGLLSDGDQLRFKPDPEILDAMREAIARKAPGWLKPGIKLNYLVIAGARKGGGIVQAGWRKLTGVLNVLAIGRKEIRENISRHQISSTTLAEAIAGWSVRQGGPGEATRWESDAVEILRRFNNEQRSNLSVAEWDALAASFWENAPKGRAAWHIAVMLLIGLSISAWIVVEPGTGGLAAKIFAGKAAMGVTTGELLACIGLGALSGTVEGGILQHGLEKMIARRQVSDFFAIAADRLGLPRNLPAPFSGKFPAPNIAECHYHEAYGRRERCWQLVHLLPKPLAKLRAALEKLSV